MIQISKKIHLTKSENLKKKNYAVICSLSDSVFRCALEMWENSENGAHNLFPIMFDWEMKKFANVKKFQHYIKKIISKIRNALKKRVVIKCREKKFSSNQIKLLLGTKSPVS
jgi:hypothetical protein